MNERDRKMISDLLDGKLDEGTLQTLQKEEKDPERLQKIAAILQASTGWDTPIVGLIQEHLVVVRTDEGLYVRCLCGHMYGPVEENWKEYALVYERPPRDGKVYRGPRGADPDWMVLREFYCPGCAAQLEVEMVPPGYPFIFNYRPEGMPR